MSSQTHIVVLKMRSLIYTAVFIFLLVVFGILMFLMFRKDENTPVDADAPVISYAPGCYSSVMPLGDTSIGVNVTVSSERIESIRLDSIPEDISKQFPLLAPAMESLTQQILEKQSLDSIEYDENMQYTQSALADTIRLALKKALPGS